MRGFAAFFRKELVEIVRTWRIWVLPMMLFFFALTGPVLARYTPELLKSLSGSTGGLTIQITAEPTYFDSYAAQWIKNLSQIVLFAIIIIYGGLVSSERKSGTAILVLTKPVSRQAFVVAKFLAHDLFLLLTVSLGAVVTWGVTLALFPAAPFGPLAAGTMAWLVLGSLFLALMALLSVAVRSQAAAAGIGFGIYAVTAVLAVSRRIALYSPVGLLGIPSQFAAGQHPEWVWPVATSLALGLGFVAAAALMFRRQEL